MNNYLSDFAIAGFQYYDGVDVFGKLKIGTEVELIPEPDNPHDGYAVAIYFKGKKLGFIPRTQNRLISKLLHFGYNPFIVKVNRISPEEHPNHQVGVVVKIREKKS